MQRWIAMLTTAVLLSGCGPFATYTRSPCPGFEVTPRAEIDVDEYSAENERILRALVGAQGESVESIEHRPYHRCPETADGGVVGVRTLARVVLPPDVSSEEFVTTFERRLREEDWILSSLETMVDDRRVRATNGYKGQAEFDLSIDPDARAFHLSIDHAVPED